MNRAHDLILGLGTTGYSVVEHLHSTRLLSVYDTRFDQDPDKVANLTRLQKEYPDVNVVSSKQFIELLPTAARVIVSPSVPLSHPLVKTAKHQAISVCGDIDLFMESVKVPVVGITGTNGKSTTVALVAAMLEQHGFLACGNIGLPVLDALKRDADGYVVELSSFQLERLSVAEFTIGSILNISSDHLDHHLYLRDYIAAKRRIYSFSRLAIFDALQPHIEPPSTVPQVALNRDLAWCIDADGIVVNNRRIPHDHIRLEGTYNQQNLLVACAISHQLGASIDDITQVVATFGNLAHRADIVGTVDGVEYVNDSKATNVAAAVASIQAQADRSRRLILICGGDAKRQSFDGFGRVVRENVATTIVFGKDRQLIATELNTSECVLTDTLCQSVRVAKKLANPGDRILLAPACSSLDLFENFAQRGEHFEQCVRGSGR